MILLRLSAVVNDVTVEVEGEANDLDQIRESWESFILATYQVEHGSTPGSIRDLKIHQENLTNPPIIEVL